MRVLFAAVECVLVGGHEDPVVEVSLGSRMLEGIVEVVVATTLLSAASSRASS